MITSSRPTPEPATTSTPEPATESDDEFTRKARLVRGIAEQISQGTAIVARWENSSNGQRLILVYRDETPPEKKGDGTWLIVSQAETENRVVSTIAVSLPVLAPGSYTCDGSGVIMGAALGTAEWKPQHPNTAWSARGGSCRISLRRTAKGALEGMFSGHLIANDRSGSYDVEMGYMHISVPPESTAGACGSEDGACFFNLGVRCHNNKDYECAFKAFAVSCKLKEGDACFNLGVMFENGEYAPKDYDKAVGAFDLACDMGVDNAPKSYLAVLYKACDEGNAGACALVGLSLTKGKLCGTHTIAPELSTGKKYLCKGCRGGSKTACEQIERMELHCPR